MKKYEYKTVKIKVEYESFSGPRIAPEFTEIINKEGAEGWRYVDTVLETGDNGYALRERIVFERELD